MSKFITGPNVGIDRIGAGFWITIVVLIILFVFIGALSFKFTFSELDASQDFQNLKKEIVSSDSLNAKSIDYQLKALELVQKEKENSRSFLIQLSQLILVNVLLPIITALLGYMFGTEKRNE